MTNFKPTYGMSYLLLRRSTISNSLLPGRKVTTPDFQALIQLALSKKLIGTTTPFTPPTQPHGGGDFVSKNTVGVYKTMGHLQNQIDKNFSQPIQNFTNAARDLQRFTRDVQGIARSTTKVWQDAKGAWDTTKKTYETIKNLKTTLSDLFSGKKKDTTAKQRLEDLLKPGENRNYFDRVRIPWTVTTVERRLRNSEDYAPIQFFVNPSKVSYSMAYTESLELVQKGHFLTSWTSPDGKNRFPALKVKFTFQSSNILAERYANTTYIKDATYGIKETSYYTPPGVKNFYDLIGILNAPRTIDAGELDLEDDQLKRYDGQANYVILKIATRLFPLLTLEGFFQGSLEFSEDAQDPLKFEAELSFIAFKSDPPWWDNDLILKRYNDFYSNEVAVGTGKNLTRVSILDDELSKFSEASSINISTLLAAASNQDGMLGNLDGKLVKDIIEDAPPLPAEEIEEDEDEEDEEEATPPEVSPAPSSPIF